MNLFDLYIDNKNHKDLTDIFTVGAQQHPGGLPANFLEKDIWVTEILRLLYDDSLLGNISVAFKGGTALSKCWNAISRFSEDIDLSIHWADLSGLSEEDELKAWQQSTKSNSQAKKFRDNQQRLLEDWSNEFLVRLNQELDKYQIEGLYAEIEPDSKGEKVDIHFPRTTRGSNDYQLDHVLLEFGGRNRGKPTEALNVETYLNQCPELSSLELPRANVKAFQQDYILWEKLTALHQFSTQTKEPNPVRLARHWYDVDCLLQNKFADPLATTEAMQAVIEMKKHRWSTRGVDFEAILSGGLRLIPDGERLRAVNKDHVEAISGKMFFTVPDEFEYIVSRLADAQEVFNQHMRDLVQKSG